MSEHISVAAFCVQEQLDAADSPGDTGREGRGRMWDVSSSKLSSSSTRALNPVFIYCHLTSLLAWPCVHKVIPVRGFLLRRKRSPGVGELQPMGACVLPVLGQEPFVSQGRSDVFGQVCSCSMPQNCCRRGNVLFSTSISYIHLDRHRFEFLSPNADAALKL